MASKVLKDKRCFTACRSRQHGAYSKVHHKAMFYWFQMGVCLSVSDLPCLLSIPGNTHSVQRPLQEPRVKPNLFPQTAWETTVILVIAEIMLSKLVLPSTARASSISSAFERNLNLSPSSSSDNRSIPNWDTTLSHRLSFFFFLKKTLFQTALDSRSGPIRCLRGRTWLPI